MAAAELPYWKTEGNHVLSAPEEFTFGPTARKLAYSAQMYHYEQQKRRLIEEEKCVSFAIVKLGPHIGSDGLAIKAPTLTRLQPRVRKC